ncbi:MAG TPA: 2-phospho-L-lactate guanylyltransferase [Propionibacteriaceae bacterium]|jgi:2-phospho-L-lactate guanylyltransferase|nr:2-phospho-L-lactate guanylyltransferase [Propionibacteriaceae bacterium]
MDTTEVDPRAAAVVALKPSEYAKSRLDLPTPLRQRLAWTMALDTLRALAPALSRVVVVSGQPALASRLARAGVSAEVVSEPAQPGINAALNHGADRLRADGAATVLACVGDLPALRAASVARVLQVSRAFPRAFLADASGVGTTMLVAHDAKLAPDFSGRSAARHRAGGAVPLTEEVLGSPLADARCDVDTEIDLATAIGLGVGIDTAALVDPAEGRLGRYQVVTTTGWTDDHGQPLAVTAAGRRVVLPDGAVANSSTSRPVRPGQRLHAVTAAGRVLSAWW